MSCILGKVYMVMQMEKQIILTLDKVMEAKGVTRYELAKRAKMQYHTVDSYYKNKVTRYDRDILLRMCLVLECEVGDIIRIL